MSKHGNQNRTNAPATPPAPPADPAAAVAAAKAAEAAAEAAAAAAAEKAAKKEAKANTVRLNGNGVTEVNFRGTAMHPDKEGVFTVPVEAVEHLLGHGLTRAR